MTSRALTNMSVAHHVIVEDSQEEAYSRSVHEKKLQTKILVLPQHYKNVYELCDLHGLSKSTGAGPARNFAWAHSTEGGHKWHWVMDDNIRGFQRLHNNLKLDVKSPAVFTIMEEYARRYKNLAMVGPQYDYFVPRKMKTPPITLNTRIFSCNLIRNSIEKRWRGRYNEDLILSLDLLYAGWCTALFSIFLQQKTPTQMMKGGNTEELYKATRLPDAPATTHYAVGGTDAKTQMILDIYPKITKAVFRYGRAHHAVQFRQFKKRNLIPCSEYRPIDPSIYEMKLVPKKTRIAEATND